MADGESISVTVLFSPRPRETQEWRLTLPAGATLLQALRASGMGSLVTDGDFAQMPVGIWGRKARLDDVLRQDDRVEIYRPLQIDPKVARRERFRKQGARAAGLFARRKSG
jgi:putative ubiquitin-RnfH superfamily antitoxin RatB of RatAB toxin-antitoxin module